MKEEDNEDLIVVIKVPPISLIGDHALGGSVILCDFGDELWVLWVNSGSYFSISQVIRDVSEETGLSVNNLHVMLPTEFNNTLRQSMDELGKKPDPPAF